MDATTMPSTKGRATRLRQPRVIARAMMTPPAVATQIR